MEVNKMDNGFNEPGAGAYFRGQREASKERKIESLEKENEQLKKRIRELEDAQKPSPNGGLAKSCPKCGNPDICYRVMKEAYQCIDCVHTWA
jgi:DNA-directed RNA polymerase subunit M/transcription elongation factor TFIIS